MEIPRIVDKKNDLRDAVELSEEQREEMEKRIFFYSGMSPVDIARHFVSEKNEDEREFIATALVRSQQEYFNEAKRHINLLILENYARRTNGRLSG